MVCLSYILFVQHDGLLRVGLQNFRHARRIPECDEPEPSVHARQEEKEYVKDKCKSVQASFPHCESELLYHARLWLYLERRVLASRIMLHSTTSPNRAKYSSSFSARVAGWVDG